MSAEYDEDYGDEQEEQQEEVHTTKFHFQKLKNRNFYFHKLKKEQKIEKINRQNNVHFTAI